eukprot:TRINITY_DN64351_c0_g1_i1.p1 TRINITY_DN64351_c0_g1~~TRINITY_DN64351_c0_g1_i1.p1  ORF type:complete len:269 (-),score=39.13 TRINITY_DN64351_c0_g1_i1:173-979(-)
MSDETKIHPEEPVVAQSEPAAQPEATPAAEASAPAEAAPVDEAEAAPKEPLCGFPGMLSAEKANINNGNTQLIYSAPISDKIVLKYFMLTQMFCCSMALCNAEQLKASTYVHLYSDRIEYNYAMSICYQIVDCQNVLFLDRDIAELSTQPDCCRPMCTFASCAPTCWDAQGQTVMLHGENHCCFSKGGKIWGNPLMNTPAAMCIPLACPQLGIGRPVPCLNRNWVFLPHLEDANALKFEIRKVRESLVAQGLAQQLTKAPESAAQNRD